MALAMTRRDPSKYGWILEEGLKRLSDEMLSQGQTVVRRRVWEPRVDLFEDHANFVLKAEIAGVRGEEIQLTYCPETHALSIKGIRHEEALGGKGVGCHLLEVYYGEFERSVVLPDVMIDKEGIRAHYRNGFLVVIVPKANPQINRGF